MANRKRKLKNSKWERRWPMILNRLLQERTCKSAVYADVWLVGRFVASSEKGIHKTVRKDSQDKRDSQSVRQ